MGKSADVLIVGAGPVGLSAAVALTQMGVSFRIIDKLSSPTNQSRAAVIHARTLEHFERLGIAENFLAAGVKIEGVGIYGTNENLLIEPSFSRLPTAYPFMLGIEQFTTEHLLTAQLKSPGIEHEVEFIDVKENDDRVLAILQYPNGSRVTEEFAYILGADGAHSQVRTALQIPLQGNLVNTTWITVDVKIKWRRNPQKAFALLSDSGIIFAAPINNNRWRVVVNFRKMSWHKAEKLTVKDVEAAVRERFKMEIAFYDPIWISPFGVSTRTVPTMQHKRIFLAGDAAHVHSPVGGQGMNMGIQDALNLTWKLALVLQGIATPELLKSYHEERHTAVQRVLLGVKVATAMANFGNPLAIQLRNQMISFFGKLGLAQRLPYAVSMLDTSYRKSPIVAEANMNRWSRAPRPGERAPDAGNLFCIQDADSRRRLFSLWRQDHRHQLLIFGSPKAHPFPHFSLYSITHIVLQGIPEQGVVIDSSGEAHAAYAVTQPGTYYLIRPDGFIAFRSGSPNSGMLIEYLDKWYRIT